MFNVSRGSFISSRSEICIKMLNAQTEIVILIIPLIYSSQTCCINA